MTAEARRQQTTGVLTVGGAYLLWGAFPIYFHALKGVPPLEVLAHRIAWSTLFMVLLVSALRRWGEVRRQLAVSGTAGVLVATAVLISLNWLVYIWAVGAGHVLEASLGYYVNPLISVLLGVVFLEEPLSRWQQAAVGLAAVGVVALMIWLGRPPWVALTLALSFGLYGLLRKRVQVDALTGLLTEVVVLLPFAAGWLGWKGAGGALAFGASPGVTTLLAAAGVVTAVPLLLFGAGVRRLRLATVGLLQYVNPTAQFLIAVFLFGEPFSAAHAVAFLFVWVALCVYTCDVLVRSRYPSA